MKYRQIMVKITKWCKRRILKSCRSLLPYHAAPYFNKNNQSMILLTLGFKIKELVQRNSVYHETICPIQLRGRLLQSC